MGKKYDKKKVKERIKAKKRQKRKEQGAVWYFCVTLGAVIAIGVSTILAMFGFRLYKNNQALKLAQASLEEAKLANYVEEAKPTSSPSPSPTPSPTPTPEVLPTKYGEIINSPDYLAENNIFVKQGSNEDVVTMGFGGDILFDDRYALMASVIQKGGDLSTGISQETLDVMNAVDIMVINNEFPYTDRGHFNPEKMFSFRAKPEMAKYLNDMGVDAAVIANNHAYDYGEEGFLDTMSTIDSVGVQYVGGGRNLEEAMMPLYYIVNDIKIAIIASTEIERLSEPNTKGATENSAGVFRSWYNERLFEAIAEAKENADFVVIFEHWGKEKETQPDSWQKTAAQKAAEAGADLIIGAHPHVLQGIYYFGDVPCLYSIGNFWFSGFNLDSCLIRVEINKEGLKSLQFMPARQAGFVTKLVHDDEYNRILNEMRTMSPEAIIDDDGYVTSKEGRG